MDERTDGVAVRVVYGTSQRVDRLKTGEFAITRAGHPAAFKLAGLAHDTKFDFKASVGLPWNERFFKPSPMRLLVGADALHSLSGHRRQQVWEATAVRTPPKLL